MAATLIERLTAGAIKVATTFPQRWPWHVVVELFYHHIPWKRPIDQSHRQVAHSRGGAC